MKKHSANHGAVHGANSSANLRSKQDAATGMTICDFDLEKDKPILCTPAGEQWRIASIDDDKISFEKLT